MIQCCIGIMAYNEEANIGHLLDTLLGQKTETVSVEEIIVVASGCTDRTENIVQSFVVRDNRVRLIQQPKREGKASAVNLLLRNTKCEVVVLQSADTLPQPQTIEALVSPFADPAIGMVGGRPVPTNVNNNFMGYGVHLMWNLHHQISLKSPKMGELIAFRNIFRQIPFDSAVDEASIEPLIIGQGMRLLYAPQAVVLNKGPETVRDFLKQRRRIYAGHVYVKDMLGYKVSTMNGSRIVWLLAKTVRLDWPSLMWLPGIVALEVFARLWGAYDYTIWRRKPYTWSIAETTKDLVDTSAELVKVT